MTYLDEAGLDAPMDLEESKKYQVWELQISLWTLILKFPFLTDLGLQYQKILPGWHIRVHRWILFAKHGNFRVGSSSNHN